MDLRLFRSLLTTFPILQSQRPIFLTLSNRPPPKKELIFKIFLDSRFWHLDFLIVSYHSSQRKIFHRIPRIFVLSIHREYLARVWFFYCILSYPIIARSEKYFTGKVERCCSDVISCFVSGRIKVKWRSIFFFFNHCIFQCFLFYEINPKNY